MATHEYVHLVHVGDVCSVLCTINGCFCSPGVCCSQKCYFHPPPQQPHDQHNQCKVFALTRALISPGFSRVMARPAGYQNLTGRVGSGQEVFEMSRDGSGRVWRVSDLAGRDGLP